MQLAMPLGGKLTPPVMMMGVMIEVVAIVLALTTIRSAIRFPGERIGELATPA